MRERLAGTGLLLATLLLAILMAPASARAADVTVTFSLFHDRLAPYGEWVSVSRYGSCWRPRRIARTWRPYTVGHWVYTDYGWTWVSGEDWGWATYHYGRWVEDPDYGWIWIPDDRWGPAYVAWRYGDGWVGWAPLPPGVSLGVSVDIDRFVRPSAYSFVQVQYFPDPGVETHIVADARNVSLIPVTRNVTRYESGGGRIVDRGVDPREIERVSGRHVAQLQVRDSADPRASRARVANNALTVYRPSTANRETGRAAAHPAPAHAQGVEAPIRARGTTGRAVPVPQRVEPPARRSEQHPRQRTQQAAHAEPRAQNPRPQSRQPRAAQQRRAAEPPRDAQHQHAAAQRRAEPRVDQHRAAAGRPAAPSRQQPAPVATSGRRASKPAAQPPRQAPNNHPTEKDQKDKKKGRE